MAKAVLEVNVIPMLNSRTSIRASYTQKLHKNNKERKLWKK